MFDTIIYFLKGCWDSFVAILQAGIDWCKYGWAWLVAAFYGLLVVTDHVLHFSVEVVDQLVNMLQYFTAPSGQVQGSVEASILKFANYVSPIEEGFAMLMGMSALFLVALLYRFIKHLVPTWGN